MTELLIILGLILLNGVFAMAEIALVSARKARLESQANKGDSQAREALLLANHPDKFLSTVQIGITLIGVLNGIFSGDAIQDSVVNWVSTFESLKPYSNGIGTAIVVIIVTYFSLVLGELLPKRIGLSNPEAIAKTLAGPMKVLSLATYPFVWMLTQSNNLLIRLLNIKKNEGQVTEEEIKAIISEGTEQGTIEEAEQEIIERVFHLGDRNITSLMTHRSDLVWLDFNDKISVIRELGEDEMHSVYPVCLDNVDNVKGMVSLKDIFRADPEAPISSIIKPALYVPENNSAYQLLERFKEHKSHYGFIVDEYGTLMGIITLNDILDAIVGDIPHLDEDNYEIVKREDSSYLIDAQYPFYNFMSYFDITSWLDEDEELEYDTLAGFILHHLERIPNVGDKVDWKEFGFEVIDMDGHRIDKILVTIPDKIKNDLEIEAQ
jgi:putative hemolysin